MEISSNTHHNLCEILEFRTHRALRDFSFPANTLRADLDKLTGRTKRRTVGDLTHAGFNYRNLIVTSIRRTKDNSPFCFDIALTTEKWNVVPQRIARIYSNFAENLGRSHINEWVAQKLLEFIATPMEFIGYQPRYTEIGPGTPQCLHQAGAELLSMLTTLPPYVHRDIASQTSDTISTLHRIAPIRTTRWDFQAALPAIKASSSISPCDASAATLVKQLHDSHHSLLTTTGMFDFSHELESLLAETGIRRDETQIALWFLQSLEQILSFEIKRLDGVETLPITRWKKYASRSLKLPIEVADFYLQSYESWYRCLQEMKDGIAKCAFESNGIKARSFEELHIHGYATRISSAGASTTPYYRITKLGRELLKTLTDAERQLGREQQFTF